MNPTNPIIAYFDAVAPTGTAAVHDLAASALRRSLKSGPVAPTLNDAETLKLSEPIAASLAVSNLIGRYRILRIARDIDAGSGDVYEFNEGEGVPWTPDDLRRLFTPRRALDYFRSIMPIEFSEPLFETLATGRAFSLAATTSEVIKTKVARVIENRIETGKLIRAAPREIEEILEEAGIPHRAGYGEMVFRTNVMESYRHGGWDQFNSPNVVAYFPVWQYTGIADGRERGADREKAAAHPELPDHHQHFRKFWPREVSFFDVRGHGAADVINCVLPGNRINGNVTKVLKANYSGPAIEIATSRGTRATVTINHPVFTEHGLIAAGQIKEGENLFTHILKPEGPSCHDVQNRPSLAEDVFAAFRSDLLSESVLALDFDGDGRFMNGNIDAVVAARMLPRQIDAGSFKYVGDFLFPFPDDGFMGGLTLSGTLLWRHLRPFQRLSLALRSRHYVGFEQTLSNRSAINTKTLGDLILRQTVRNVGFSKVAVTDDSSSSDRGCGTITQLDSRFCEPVHNRLEIYTDRCGNRVGRLVRKVPFDNVRHISGHSRAKASGFGGVANFDADRDQFSLDGCRRNADFAGDGRQAFAGNIPLCDGPELWDLGTASAPFGSASDFHIAIDKPLPNSLVAYSKFITKLQRGSPGKVPLDKVVHVRRFHYDGPVYDVETVQGYFSTSCDGSEGILSRNCRCDFLPVDKREWARFLKTGAVLQPPP